MQRLFKIVWKLFIISLFYLVLCRWVMPPITITQFSSFLNGDGLKRDYISWQEISPNVKLAAIASEDQLFLSHSGFDWLAIQKSFGVKNKSKKTKRPLGSAASTISQQTAKNVFLWQGAGWSKYLRKAPEFLYTFLIELTWGKERILEIYLNTIEMGKGIYGIEAAAKSYFKKSAKNLSRQEAAQIIACLPNPKRFTVVPKSKRVAWRYPQIMRQMNNIESDPLVRQIIKP